MKKLKYLLFIIPLFFIFSSTSKAFDLATCGSTTITDMDIYNALSNHYSDFDTDINSYMWCERISSGSGTCYFFDDSILNLSSSYGSDNQAYYFLYYPTLKSYNAYFSITNCTIGTLWNSSANSQVPLKFPKTLSSNSFTYTNFDSTAINNSVSNPYAYNVLHSFLPEPEPETPTIEDKIYLPDELEEGNCPIILNKDVIRVYDEEPTVNTLVSYTDYFINSHYIKQTGYDMPTDTVTCLDLDDFTTSYVYRFDFDKIIVIFVSILFLISYPVMKIIHAFFVGFKRR